MPDQLADLLPDTFEGRDGLTEKFNGDGGVEALATGYLQLQANQSRPFLPAEGAPIDQWNAFNKGFGVPESAAGYANPEGSSEGFGNLLTGIKEKALEAGVSGKQWDIIAGAAKVTTDSQLAEQKAVVDTARAAWQTAAKTKYGDQLEEKLAMGQRWLEKQRADNPDFGKVMEAAGAFDHPDHLDFAIRAGETVGHGRTPTMDGGEKGTPAIDLPKHVAEMVEIDSRMAELTSKNPYDPRLTQLGNQYAGKMKELTDAGYESGFNHPDILPLVNPAAAMERDMDHKEAVREAANLAGGGAT